MYKRQDLDSPELLNYLSEAQAKRLKNDLEIIEGVYPELNLSLIHI